MRLFTFLVISILLTSCRTSDLIVFSTDRNGNSDLFTMNGKGKQIKPVTSSPAEEWAPAPRNPMEVTFLRQDSTGITRWAVDLKTGEETEIGHPDQCVLDDKNALYAPGLNAYLYKCDGQLYLAYEGQDSAFHLNQSLPGKATKYCWAADGVNIAFAQENGDRNDLWRVTIFDHRPVRLTDTPYREDAPALSPDGSTILYTSNQEGNNNQDLYLMNVFTKKSENITNTPDWELIGRWSEDGRKVYFGSNRDGNWEIYSYHIKRETTRRLTNHNGFDGDPRIVFRR